MGHVGTGGCFERGMDETTAVNGAFIKKQELFNKNNKFNQMYIE